MENRQRISQETVDKCNSIEDVLDIITHNGKLKYSGIGNKGQDYTSFLNRHYYFKERLAKMLPDFTPEEILKFDAYYFTYKEAVYEMSGFNWFLDVLEFEQRKGLL